MDIWPVHSPRDLVTCSSQAASFSAQRGESSLPRLVLRDKLTRLFIFVFILFYFIFYLPFLALLQRLPSIISIIYSYILAGHYHINSSFMLV
jgi:hypothetical protein